jgi:hypothetical protein
VGVVPAVEVSPELTLLQELQLELELILLIAGISLW